MNPFEQAWSLLKQNGAARAMGWDVPTNMENRQVSHQRVQQPTATNTVGNQSQTQQDAQAFGQHLAGTTVGNVAQGGTLSVPNLTHMAQAPNVFQQPSHSMGTTLSAPNQVSGYSHG